MPLSRRASLEAQRMMREAFTDLGRVITVADRAQLEELTLDDVRQAALQVENQLAASQSLRNMRKSGPFSDPELIALSYDWLVLKKKPPNCAVIEQLLRLLVEALGTSPSQQRTLHIMFDGLDECDDSTVTSVVKTLDKLVATASSSGANILKVLLCTQMTPAVAKVVKRKRQISLSDEKVHLNRAIQDYTLQRINAIRPNLSQLRITEGDVAKLASQITEKADGMFLWAKLVMEFISKNFFYSREEILEAASQLPRELGKL
ncbi:hypothetical protein J3F83DRAFT_711564 [Trichoderma novae-zelandiae]